MIFVRSSAAIAMLWLVAVAGGPRAGWAGEATDWSPRRSAVGSAETLPAEPAGHGEPAGRVSLAQHLAAGNGPAAQPTTGGAGDDLRWRPRDEAYVRTAQVPSRALPESESFAPALPSPLRVAQAVPGAMSSAEGFMELPAAPSTGPVPGAWPPGPMGQAMPGYPYCPPGGPIVPGYMPYPGYGPPGYGPPCPPGVMPPPMPSAVPVPTQPAPQVTVPTQPMATVPENSNIPLLPPNLFGSLFGAQPQSLGLSFDHAFHTRGSIISGAPGSPAAVLAFEQNGGFPDDFTSIPGTARDVSGDGLPDTFNMTEPLPPNEVPTSPGPGYRYVGGTVSYTNSPVATTAQDGVFQDNELWFAQYSFARELEIPAAGALSVRRMYVAQNNSPIPRDRLFFDLRFFKDARPDLGDIYWYTGGLEKTFNRDQGSIEVRLPFAHTLDNEVFEGEPGGKSTEFGNLSFTLKHILWGNERWLFSGGTGLSLPTGPDTRFVLSDGTEVLAIDNDAVHLQPFLAALWLPHQHFFVESFVGVDFDVRGNTVRGNITGGRLPTIGEYRSATVLMADLAVGHWIYTNPSFRAALQGVAVAGELSYQTSLEDADSVSGNGITLTGTSASVDMLSTVLGLHAYLFNQLALSGGVGLPLSSGDEKEYDLSAIFMANWHF